VVGLDPRTGTNRWRLERPKTANWSSPVAFDAPDGQPLVGLQSAADFSVVGTGHRPRGLEAPGTGVDRALGVPGRRSVVRRFAGPDGAEVAAR